MKNFEIYLIKNKKEKIEQYVYLLSYNKDKKTYWFKNINENLASLPWIWNFSLSEDDFEVKKQIQKEDIKNEKGILKKDFALALLSN